MEVTTSREEYVEQLKIQVDRCNAEIRRQEAKGAAGKEIEALREQRQRALNKLRLLG
jgi:hypothetical protein